MDDHNIEIENDLKKKYEIQSQNIGGWENGLDLERKLTRCEFIIEPASAKAVENWDIDIFNCSVLPDT